MIVIIIKNFQYLYRKRLDEKVYWRLHSLWNDKLVMCSGSAWGKDSSWSFLQSFYLEGFIHAAESTKRYKKKSRSFSAHTSLSFENQQHENLLLQSGSLYTIGYRKINWPPLFSFSLGFYSRGFTSGAYNEWFQAYIIRVIIWEKI